MKNIQEKVAEFQKQFNNPILETPSILKDRVELRVGLIQEELNELKESIRNNDLVEIADALGDLQYVLSGAILEFGFGECFEEIFNEIHRSNMSKACDTVDIAEKTIKFYKEKDGTESYYEKIRDKYVVYRKKDKKVLKSVNYSSVNLIDILSKY